MKAGDQGDEMLGPPLQRYFCGYLINQRQLSPRTIAAYRDTFRLLLGFLEQRQGIKPEGLRLRDLDADRVLAFLDDLERTRRNCARSRNARLAAIRSFVRFAAASNPLLLPIAQRVLAIPSKRFERGVVRHLAPRQVQALLDAPDGSTWTGLRDRVLLTLMYNTGARVSELAALKVGDLRLENGGSGSVHLRGKGRKQRAVPLWRESLRLVRSWLDEIGAPSDAPLLPNGQGGHLSRSGIEHRLRLAARRAAVADPALGPFQVSPHTIRHTTAMHLLQSGVDLSLIAMWLGHESIETTHQYLDADLESKKRALAHLASPKVRPPRQAKRTQSLVEFLRRL
ncbi:MAG TPA: tyrosine-type recombinase/integrase [Solirubrobacterales bacterium]|nr:tyrosine-type recombinase/integrase [Solirubrobacterales bacterium]